MVLSRVSLGINFGDDRVDVVCLKRSFRETVLIDHCSVPYSSDEIDKDAFNRELTLFLEKNGLLGISPYVALSRSSVVLTNITLPVAAEENMREVIGYQLGSYSPFPKEKAYFDYKLIDRNSEENTIRVLLAVIEKDRFNSYLELLNGVGLSPASVEISSTALLETLPQKNIQNGRVNALLHMGTNYCEILLASARELRYSRVFKRTYKTVELILKEFERAELASGKGVAAAEIESLFVSGEEAKNKILMRILVEKTGKEVVEIDSVNGLKTDRWKEMSSFRVVLGCALRGLSKSKAMFNFLSADVEEGEMSYKWWFAAIFCSLFLVIFMWGGGNAMRIAKEKEILNSINDEMKVLGSEVKPVEEAKKMALILEKRISHIEDFKKDRVSSLLILQELTGILPDDTYLTMLKYNKGEIQIVGRSKSAVSLISLIEASAMFKDAQFSATVTRRDSRRRTTRRRIFDRSRARRQVKNTDEKKEETIYEEFRIKATLVGTQ